MARAYTEEDYTAMQRIADGAVLDNVKDLAEALGEPDFGPKLIATDDLTPDFRHRLEMLVIGLEYLLDTAKSRLAKATS